MCVCVCVTASAALVCLLVFPRPVGSDHLCFFFFVLHFFFFSLLRLGVEVLVAQNGRFSEFENIFFHLFFLPRAGSAIQWNDDGMDGELRSCAGFHFGWGCGGGLRLAGWKTEQCDYPEGADVRSVRFPFLCAVFFELQLEQSEKRRSFFPSLENN